MKTENLVTGVVGGIIAGFALGLGFYLSQRVVHRKNGAVASAPVSTPETATGFDGAETTMPERRPMPVTPRRRPARPSAYADFDFTTGQGKW